MKRKNVISLLAAAVLCLALPLGALAEADAPDTLLEGLVTEIVDGGFVMEDIEIGEVMLNVDETTVMDGDLAEGELEVGQYVFVQYDGRLTRSLPPQAHADKVGCYTVIGAVSQFLENGLLISGDERYGDIIVRVNGSMPHVYADVPITVYFDGVMALSLPGQVNARYIIVPQLSGTVSEKDDKGFTLTDENSVSYRVLVTEETLTGIVSSALEEIVATDEAETPNEAAETTEAPQESFDEPGEAEAEPIDEDASEPVNDAVPDGGEPEVAPTIEWGDGDLVTVYYNGVMTKSVPPQVTALEVQVER